MTAYELLDKYSNEGDEQALFELCELAGISEVMFDYLWDEALREGESPLFYIADYVQSDSDLLDKTQGRLDEEDI